MNRSEKFELERSNAIAQLKMANASVERILANSYLLRIEENQVSKMNSVLERNKKFLHKLESNEFEIAIVGLEKAGKSTFANSLIENSVLPSAPERCTFTATRLVSGADKASVDFYTENEFNEIFRQILSEIKFPNAEGESFRTLSLERFNKYFASLEDVDRELYKNHTGKTDEEIRDIIKNRDRLILTGNGLQFSGDDLLGDAFQAYIKGESKGADTSKPRSVKKIQIESSKLNKLETAVLYDVPGFDSPTKIHIRQTEERLKMADAIILVTNVGTNPSIQGTSLNIINKNTDEDGIQLRDKLFVFGNQLDRVNNDSEIQGNKEILIKDVEKYKIGKRERVFAGSALKYLVEKGIVTHEYHPKINVDSGVEDIRIALIHYYENDRFEVLRRKIDSSRDALRDILIDIFNGFELGFDADFSENEKARITRGTSKRIEIDLEKALRALKDELKTEIWEAKYFSGKFQQDVAHFSCFQEISDADIGVARRSSDDSVTRDVPIQKINQTIRTGLHGKFLNDFSRLIKNITDEKSREIEIRILRAFSNAVLGDDRPDLFDEVEAASRFLVKSLTDEISHNEGRFTYLIERFSRDVFDILISNPLFSRDRLNKYRAAEKEFLYLDNYYQGGNGTLVRMLLTGCGAQTIENGALGILSDVEKSIDSISDVMARSTGISVQISRVVLEKANLALGHFLSMHSEKGIPLGSLSDIADKLPSATEDAVLNEINMDISNLREILRVAVVPAINLELAFVNAIDKQIKVLIDSSKGVDGRGHQLFNDFIARMILKIKKSELDGINQKIEENQLRYSLIQEMKSIKI